MLNRRSMMFGAVAGLGLAGGGVHGSESELRDKALELMQVRINNRPVNFKVLKHNRWNPYPLNVFSMEGPEDTLVNKDGPNGPYRGCMCNTHTIYCANKQEREFIVNELIALGATEDTSEPILFRDKV